MKVLNQKQTGKDKAPHFVIEIQSDSEVNAMSLPKKKVKNCQKKAVINEYRGIPLIPEIKLSVEDMKGDPVELLMRLQKEYEVFGAVKIVTPPEWSPPFCFRFSDKGITTRIQHLHKLKLGKVLFFQMPGISFQPYFFLIQSFKQKEEAYNVGSFKETAKQFQKNYKFRCAQDCDNKSDQEEKEYWSLVNWNHDGPQWKFRTTIEYAADLPVKNHGSGFPISENRKTKDENFDYYRNLFNINNLYKSPSSILRIVDERKEYISGITTPWVYMGMMFSTFCWHVEDLWLNSLNYSHIGATKTWYIIPRTHKEAFDQYVLQKTGKKDLLDRITYMLDPLEVMAHGIPVYKANQNPGQYICTFYKAYHSGFSHGFNVGEAVNFASMFSLRYMKEARKSYASNPNKGPSVISYEWLVYQNKRKRLEFPKHSQILEGEYEKIISEEYKRLKEVVKKYRLKEWIQIPSSCKYDRNACCKCRNYQYLSSIKCKNCGKNYCYEDVIDCCDKSLQLVLREPKEERKRLMSLCKSK